MQSLTDRKNMFKKGLDQNDNRRRREETRLQIRKSKKEEQLMKRRQQLSTQQDHSVKSDEDKKEKVFTKNDIPSLMNIIQMGNAAGPEQTLEAVRGFRRMLSVESDPPVDEVLSAGALPYLVNYLCNQDNSMLSFEAAWALTNIASTNRTQKVVDGGAVPYLISLLRHSRPELREQAAWCLGNVAGDSPELRDLVLEGGAMDGLVLNVKEPETESLLNNVTWAISNLCRGKPSPRLDYVSPAIQPLSELLFRDVGRDVIVDAVWALSYLADGENDRIQKVMETNLTPRLVEFLGNDTPALTTPTVRCLGNFVTGDDTQTQAVIDSGFLKHALRLLNHPMKNVRKETCWLLSNIAAGTTQQIKELFFSQELLPKVIELAHDSRWEVRREAIWVVSNIFTTGSAEQVKELVQLEGLDAISLALTVKDSKIIMVALEAVEKILLVGEKENLGYNQMLEEYHGIDRIEDLQEHPNEEVYNKCVEIMERFFGIEEEEDENVAPSTNDDGTYGFGLPSKQLFQSENEGYSQNQFQAPVTFNFGGSNGTNHSMF